MEKNIIKRKASFVNSAIEILDEQGIVGLTTRELAKREGVTEPVLYRQFKNKNEILLAVIDEYAKFDVSITNTISQQEMPFREAILFYFRSYAEYYQTYPQITTIMFSFDIYRYNEHTKKRMMEVIQARLNFMEALARKGREEGIISKSLEPNEVADILCGLLWSATYCWRINHNYENTDLKSILERRANLVLKSFT